MQVDMFGDEHQLFRSQCRRFIEKELAPHADAWEDARDFPDEVFRKVGAAGFFGIRVPEAYGGSDGDHLLATVWIEECAGAGSAGVIAGINMHGLIILPALARFANEDQKRRFLVPGVRGEKIGALGLTEPGVGSDLANCRTTAKRDGDHWILNGAKMFITNGCRADFVLVLCKTDPAAGYGGFSTLIVEKGMPGFDQGKRLEKLGWHASDTAELAFDNVRVPAANLLGEEGQGFYNAMANLEWERLMMAIGAVAGSQRAWEKTLEYVREREAFGRPIGRFQVNRHKMVDMATEIEAARQLNYHCLRMVLAERPCLKEVSMAKIFACEMADRVATTCLQLHGGYGYMKEYRIERFFRDARLNTIGGGTTEIMKEIIGKLIGL
jgi:alkylation response protein AidB-like acyl-CoA dehydrogenase